MGVAVRGRIGDGGESVVVWRGREGLRLWCGCEEFRSWGQSVTQCCMLAEEEGRGGCEGEGAERAVQSGHQPAQGSRGYDAVDGDVDVCDVSEFVASWGDVAWNC